MKFPNKVTPYKNSILHKLPLLLGFLKEKDYTISSLYEKLNGKITAREYIDALDCLFILGKISLNKEVLHYVA